MKRGFIHSLILHLFIFSFTHCVAQQAPTDWWFAAADTLTVEEAEPIFARCIKSKKPLEVGQGYALIATVFRDNNRSEDLVTAYFLKAQTQFQIKGDSLNIQIINMILADTYFNGFNPDTKTTPLEAEKMLKNCEVFFNRYKYKTYHTYALQSLASLYLYSSRYEEAKVYIDRARELHDPNLDDNLRFAIELWSVQWYQGQKRYQEAFVGMEKYRQFLEKKPKKNPVRHSIAYFYLGILSYYQQQPARSVPYLLEAEKIVSQIKDDNLNTFKQKADVAHHLMLSYEALKNPEKALVYAKKYGDWARQAADVRDSPEVLKELKAFEQIRLDLEKANLLQRETQQSLASKQNQNTVLILTLLLLFSLGVFLFYSFINLQKRRRAEKQLAKQALKTTQIRSLLEGEQRERARTARDLHDSVGNSLVRLKMFIEQKSSSHPEKEKTLGIINDITQELRAVTQNASAERMKTLGLKGALSEYGRKLAAIMEKPRIELSFLGEEQNMDSLKMLAIYRIVEEVMGNIIKHNNAERIKLQVSFFEDEYIINIEDNGTINPTTRPTTGEGLLNLETRIEFLAAHLDSHYSPSQGTSVVCTVPVR